MRRNNPTFLNISIKYFYKHTFTKEGVGFKNEDILISNNFIVIVIMIISVFVIVTISVTVTVSVVIIFVFSMVIVLLFDIAIIIVKITCFALIYYCC